MKPGGGCSPHTGSNRPTGDGANTGLPPNHQRTQGVNRLANTSQVFPSSPVRPWQMPFQPTSQLNSLLSQVGLYNGILPLPHMARDWGGVFPQRGTGDGLLQLPPQYASGLWKPDLPGSPVSSPLLSHLTSPMPLPNMRGTGKHFELPVSPSVHSPSRENRSVSREPIQNPGTSISGSSLGKNSSKSPNITQSGSKNLKGKRKPSLEEMVNKLHGLHKPVQSASSTRAQESMQSDVPVPSDSSPCTNPELRSESTSRQVTVSSCDPNTANIYTAHSSTDSSSTDSMCSDKKVTTDSENICVEKTTEKTTETCDKTLEKSPQTPDKPYVPVKPESSLNENIKNPETHRTSDESCSENLVEQVSVTGTSPFQKSTDVCETGQTLEAIKVSDINKSDNESISPKNESENVSCKDESVGKSENMSDNTASLEDESESESCKSESESSVSCKNESDSNMSKDESVESGKDESVESVKDESVECSKDESDTKSVKDESESNISGNDNAQSEVLNTSMSEGTRRSSEEGIIKENPVDRQEVQENDGPADTQEVKENDVPADQREVKECEISVDQEVKEIDTPADLEEINDSDTPTDLEEVKESDTPADLEEIQESDTPADLEEIKESDTPADLEEVKESDTPADLEEVKKSNTPADLEEVEESDAPVDQQEVKEKYVPVDQQEVKEIDIPVDQQEVQEKDSPVDQQEVKESDAPVDQQEVKEKYDPIDKQVKESDAPVDQQEVKESDAYVTPIEVQEVLEKDPSFEMQEVPESATPVETKEITEKDVPVETHEENNTPSDQQEITEKVPVETQEVEESNVPVDQQEVMEPEQVTEKEVPVPVDQQEVMETEQVTEKEVPVDQEEKTEKEVTVDHQEVTESDVPVEMQEKTEKEVTDHQEVTESDVPVEMQDKTEKEVPVEMQDKTEKEVPVDHQETTEKEVPVDHQETTEKEVPVDEQEATEKEVPLNQQETTEKEVPVPVDEQEKTEKDHQETTEKEVSVHLKEGTENPGLSDQKAETDIDIAQKDSSENEEENTEKEENTDKESKDVSENEENDSVSENEDTVENEDIATDIDPSSAQNKDGKEGNASSLSRRTLETTGGRDSVEIIDCGSRDSDIEVLYEKSTSGVGSLSNVEIDEIQMCSKSNMKEDNKGEQTNIKETDRDSSFVNTDSGLVPYLEPISDDENSLLCAPDESSVSSVSGVQSSSNTPMFSDTPSENSCGTLMVKISDAVAAILSDVSDDSLPDSPLASNSNSVDGFNAILQRAKLSEKIESICEKLERDCARDSKDSYEKKKGETDTPKSSVSISETVDKSSHRERVTGDHIKKTQKSDHSTDSIEKSGKGKHSDKGRNECTGNDKNKIKRKHSKPQVTSEPKNTQEFSSVKEGSDSSKTSHPSKISSDSSSTHSSPDKNMSTKSCPSFGNHSQTSVSGSSNISSHKRDCNIHKKEGTGRSPDVSSKAAMPVAETPSQSVDDSDTQGIESQEQSGFNKDKGKDEPTKNSKSSVGKSKHKSDIIPHDKNRILKEKESSKSQSVYPSTSDTVTSKSMSLESVSGTSSGTSTSSSSIPTTTDEKLGITETNPSTGTPTKPIQEAKSQSRLSKATTKSTEDLGDSKRVDKSSKKPESSHNKKSSPKPEITRDNTSKISESGSTSNKESNNIPKVPNTSASCLPSKTNVQKDKKEKSDVLLHTTSAFPLGESTSKTTQDSGDKSHDNQESGKESDKNMSEESLSVPVCLDTVQIEGKRDQESKGSGVDSSVDSSSPSVSQTPEVLEETKKSPLKNISVKREEKLTSEVKKQEKEATSDSTTPQSSPIPSEVEKKITEGRPEELRVPDSISRQTGEANPDIKPDPSEIEVSEVGEYSAVPVTSGTLRQSCPDTLADETKTQEDKSSPPASPGNHVESESAKEMETQDLKESDTSINRTKLMKDMEEKVEEDREDIKRDNVESERSISLQSSHSKESDETKNSTPSSETMEVDDSANDTPIDKESTAKKNEESTKSNPTASPSKKSLLKLETKDTKLDPESEETPIAPSEKINRTNEKIDSHESVPSTSEDRDSEQPKIRSNNEEGIEPQQASVIGEEKSKELKVESEAIKLETEIQSENQINPASNEETPSEIYDENKLKPTVKEENIEGESDEVDSALKPILATEIKSEPETESRLSQNIVEILTTENPNKIVGTPCPLCHKTFDGTLDVHLTECHICTTFIHAKETRIYKNHMLKRVQDLIGEEVKICDNFFVCRSCNFASKSIDAVRFHLNSHENVYQVRQGNVLCDCIRRSYSFESHKWSSLIRTSDFYCFKCNYYFGCEKGMRSHIQAMHFIESHCKECKSFVSTEDMVMHLNSHKPEPEIETEEPNSTQATVVTRSGEEKQSLSWNIYDNSLNYLDGKYFRLSTKLKVKDPNLDRSYLELPLKCDLEDATVPEEAKLDPAKDIGKYLRSKKAVKLPLEDGDTTQKNFSLSMQMDLLKKMSKRSRRTAGGSSRRKEDDLLAILGITAVRTRSSRRESLANIEPVSLSLPTLSRKIRSRIEDLGDGDRSDSQRLTRTRSGMQITSREDEKPVEEEKVRLPVVDMNITVDGEWSKEHTYICCSCGAGYLNLADIMDHKWEMHPSVWCAHTMIQGQNGVPTSFCLQYRPPTSRPCILPLPNNPQVTPNNTTNTNNTSSENVTRSGSSERMCTSCRVSFHNVGSFHAHLVECGGLSLLSAAKKKSKKGFRFKRRKGQGIPNNRYGNISHPSTPLKAKNGDRSSGLNTPLNDRSGAAAIHSCGVKRRLEMAVGSIDNVELKNRLKAIISGSRASGGGSAASIRRNVRMKLRKKVLENRKLRKTRHSDRVKEIIKEQQNQQKIKDDKGDQTTPKAEDSQAAKGSASNKGEESDEAKKVNQEVKPKPKKKTKKKEVDKEGGKEVQKTGVKKTIKEEDLEIKDKKEETEKDPEDKLKTDKKVNGVLVKKKRSKKSVEGENSSLKGSKSNKAVQTVNSVLFGNKSIMKGLTIDEKKMISSKDYVINLTKKGVKKNTKKTKETKGENIPDESPENGLLKSPKKPRSKKKTPGNEQEKEEERSIKLSKERATKLVAQAKVKQLKIQAKSKETQDSPKNIEVEENTDSKEDKEEVEESSLGDSKNKGPKKKTEPKPEPEEQQYLSSSEEEEEEEDSEDDELDSEEEYEPEVVRSYRSGRRCGGRMSLRHQGRPNTRYSFRTCFSTKDEEEEEEENTREIAKPPKRKVDYTEKDEEDEIVKSMSAKRKRKIANYENQDDCAYFPNDSSSDLEEEDFSESEASVTGREMTWIPGSRKSSRVASKDGARVTSADVSSAEDVDVPAGDENVKNNKEITEKDNISAHKTARIRRASRIDSVKSSDTNTDSEERVSSKKKSREVSSQPRTKKQPKRPKRKITKPRERKLKSPYDSTEPQYASSDNQGTLCEKPKKKRGWGLLERLELNSVFQAQVNEIGGNVQRKRRSVTRIEDLVSEDDQDLTGSNTDSGTRTPDTSYSNTPTRRLSLEDTEMKDTGIKRRASFEDSERKDTGTKRRASVEDIERKDIKDIQRRASLDSEIKPILTENIKMTEPIQETEIKPEVSADTSAIESTSPKKSPKLSPEKKRRSSQNLIEDISSTKSENENKNEIITQENPSQNLNESKLPEPGNNLDQTPKPLEETIVKKPVVKRRRPVKKRTPKVPLEPSEFKGHSELGVGLDDDDLPLSALVLKNKKPKTPRVSKKKARSTKTVNKDNNVPENVSLDLEDNVSTEGIVKKSPGKKKKRRVPLSKAFIYDTNSDSDSEAPKIESVPRKDSPTKTPENKSPKTSENIVPVSASPLDQLGDKPKTHKELPDLLPLNSENIKAIKKKKPAKPRTPKPAGEKKNTGKAKCKHSNLVSPELETKNLEGDLKLVTTDMEASTVPSHMTNTQRRRTLSEKLQEVQAQLSSQVMRKNDTPVESHSESKNTEQLDQPIEQQSPKKSSKPVQSRKKGNSKNQTKHSESALVPLVQENLSHSSPQEPGTAEVVTAASPPQPVENFKSQKKPGKRKRAASTVTTSQVDNQLISIKDINQSPPQTLTPKKVSESAKKRKSVSKRVPIIDKETNELTCRDCGLVFGSIASLEDHRQDCVTIALEMSLMQAEDHIYECPHCQVTFAKKGTQRKHTVSCRMGKYRRGPSRESKALKKNAKNAEASLIQLAQLGNNRSSVVGGGESPTRRALIKGRRCSKENVAGEGDMPQASPLRDNFKVLLSHNDKEITEKLPEKSVDCIQRVLSLSAAGSPTKSKRESHVVNGRPVNGELKEVLSISDNQFCSVCKCETPDKDASKKHQLLQKFSFCCQQQILIEICTLIAHYNFSTDTVRSMVNCADGNQEHISLNIDTALQPPSSSNNSVEKLKEIITSPHCTWMLSVIESLVKRHQNTGNVNITGSQQEVLKAVSLLEELLIELSDTESTVENKHIMREHFEAGTRN